MSEKEKDTYNLNPSEGQITLDLQIKTGAGFDVENVVRDEWQLRIDPATVIPVGKISAVTIKNIVNDVQYDVYVQNNNSSSTELKKLRIRKIAIDFDINTDLEIEIAYGLNRNSSINACKQAFDAILDKSSFFDERGQVEEFIFADRLNHNHWKMRFVNGEMTYLEISDADFDEAVPIPEMDS